VVKSLGGLRNKHYLEATSPGITGLREYPKILLGPFPIGAVLSRGALKDHKAGANKTGQIIHMAIRFISPESLSEPNDRVYPKIVPKILFYLCSTQLGISIRSQKTLFGSKKSSFPIHMNRTTFQNKGGIKTGEPQPRKDVRGKLVIGLIGMVFFSPGVKLPVNPCAPPLNINQNSGTIIPHPGIIVGEFPDLHRSGKATPGILTCPIPIGFLQRPGYHDKGLEFCNGPGYFHIAFPGFFKACQPGFFSHRPGHESSLPGKPFGGHPKTLFPRKTGHAIRDSIHTTILATTAR